MVIIETQAFDQFYAPLVSGEAEVEALTQNLTAGVQSSPDQDNFHSSDPYARLQNSFTKLVIASSADVNGLTYKERLSMGANGFFAGVLAVNTLRTVGDIYTSRSVVPQKPESVQQSTDRALRHLFGIAFAGPNIASYNLEAHNLGLNPKNLLAAPALVVASALPVLDLFAKGRRNVSKRSFSVSEDTAGQISIAPRYHRVKRSANGRQCPAAFSTVKVAGKPRSALFTLMRTLGSVAASEIFPNYFHIEEPADPTQA